ncbi:MAG: DUF3977 family protein [Chthoniobacterales bacterium]|nr:DUF3977 family protein [Chthoniobacterales bacterium]
MTLPNTKGSALFTEIGIDFDNNKYGIGISTEMEDRHGKEIRISGLVEMRIQGVYVRIWILKTVLGIGIPRGLVIKRKTRNNFKLVLGIAGIK